MNEKTSMDRVLLTAARRKPPREALPVDSSTLPAGCVQRAQLTPQQLTARDLLALQRNIGNSAVSRLMQSGQFPIQTKREAGYAEDRYELEADHVARQVTRVRWRRMVGALLLPEDLRLDSTDAPVPFH